MTQNQPVLPQDPTTAVKQITKLIEQFIDLMDREAMAMAKRDAISFAALQDDKNRLSDTYEKASAEFGERLPQFRSVDGALIDRLNKLQEDLKIKVLDSTKTMERMKG